MGITRRGACRGAVDDDWIGVLFSVYTANFGSYNEIYGALGTVVVVMLWLLLTIFVVLLGAEVNCELERLTTRDTTETPPRHHLSARRPRRLRG